MAGLIDFGITRPETYNAFASGYNQAEQNRNALLQQQQQRQMADIQLKNALREQAQAEAESQAWQSGAGNPQEVLKNLQGAGLGKQAMALQAQMAKAQTDKLTALKVANDLKKNTATSIFANPTLENAIAATQAFGQQTGMDVSGELAQLQGLGNNPDAIKQWAAGHALEADKLLPKFQSLGTNAAVVMGKVNPLTGEFEQTGAIAKGISDADKQRLALEGQRVGLEQQRVGLEGRRVSLAEKAQGTEGLPPKEIQKREAAFPQQTSAIKGFEAKSDNFIRDLKALRDHPGLGQITGAIFGRTGSLSKEGSAAQALYDKVLAKGGFQALQDLREASKTGGALGNISNQEGKQLTASFAAIDRRQNAEDVKAAIDQAIGDIEGAKTRMREAYDTTYSYKSGQQPKPVAPAAASGATVSNW